MTSSVDLIHRVSEMQAPVVIMAFCFIVFLEVRRPLRERHTSFTAHAKSNILLSLLNFCILGTFSFAMIEYTFVAYNNGWGLFNALGMQSWVAIIFQVIAYDFLGYVLHRTFHSHDFMWLMHRVHHSDTDMDATTTFRFHPSEGIFRLIFQGLFMVAIGFHPYAIVVYNLFAIPVFLLSHANVKLPVTLEHWLGQVFVMPGDHTIHHRPDRAEHDHNYGSMLIIFDRLLGTYKSIESIEERTTGLDGYDPAVVPTVREMLADPWQGNEPTPPHKSQTVMWGDDKAKINSNIITGKFN